MSAIRAAVLAVTREMRTARAQRVAVAPLGGNPARTQLAGPRQGKSPPSSLRIAKPNRCENGVKVRERGREGEGGMVAPLAHAHAQKEGG